MIIYRFVTGFPFGLMLHERCLIWIVIDSTAAMILQTHSAFLLTKDNSDCMTIDDATPGLNCSWPLFISERDVYTVHLMNRCTVYSSLSPLSVA